jgi:hypothetical protein
MIRTYSSPFISQPPISEDHEHWFAFPLGILRTSDAGFTYRVFPRRFAGTTTFFSSSALADEVQFLQFSRDVDNLLENRINSPGKETSAKLTKFVLLGGSQALNCFPPFLRRIEKYKKGWFCA